LKFTSNYLNYVLKTLGKSSFCATNSEKQSSNVCISIKCMIYFSDFMIKRNHRVEIFVKFGTFI
jgi:hypothetical protein